MTSVMLNNLSTTSGSPSPIREEISSLIGGVVLPQSGIVRVVSKKLFHHHVFEIRLSKSKTRTSYLA
jgi:hypothetical protein